MLLKDVALSYFTDEQALDNLQVDIDTIKASLSLHMLTAAKECATIEVFLRECKVVEKDVKQAKSVTKMPNAWTQHKSDIKRAWKAGIEPASVECVADMKDKLIEQRKDAGVSTAKPTDDVQDKMKLLSEALKALNSERGEAHVIAVLDYAIEYAGELINERTSESDDTIDAVLDDVIDDEGIDAATQDILDRLATA